MGKGINRKKSMNYSLNQADLDQMKTAMGNGHNSSDCRIYLDGPDNNLDSRKNCLYGNCDNYQRYDYNNSH